MRTYFQEMLKRKDLLYYLVKSGLKADNRNSYLGYFWWLLDPLLNVLVYYFLLKIVLNRGEEEPFAVFLVIGLVAWRWAQTTINSSAKSIMKHGSIINQVYLPKSIFPISVAFTQMVNFSFGLIIVATFLAFFGVMPGWQVVYIPLIILTQLVFLLSIGMFLAYITVFVRDIDHLLTHVTRILFYASPIIWAGGRLKGEELVIGSTVISLDFLVDYNPIAILVGSYRNVLMYQTNPDFLGLLNVFAISFLLFYVMIYFYSKNEHKIIKAL
ncbi:ABC transporter permease [Alkalibacillus haloalkaliphilus]|uniref:ABC transporter permease n=1 Tax=Alkalibacillus haloalkaliphilus TaxID=94136 RepID=UPI00030E66A7|nr:ABC transporter permease [Alkalibacillus haloalkaliphilus]